MEEVEKTVKKMIDRAALSATLIQAAPWLFVLLSFICGWVISAKYHHHDYYLEGEKAAIIRYAEAIREYEEKYDINDRDDNWIPFFWGQDGSPVFEKKSLWQKFWG